MRFRRSRPCERFLETLESRQMLSEVPIVHDLSILDANSYSAGHPITLVTHATDDVGVRAVTFFVDVNADNEWTPGTDRHLGDLFAPDSGTSDRYTFTFIADWDTPGACVRIRFAANAVDTEGQWPVTAYTAETDIYQRLIVSQFLVEPVSSTQARLTATVNAPFGASSTGMRGVTFWYDANGNNAWDAGIDTDLGYSETAHGAQQRDFTITPTINPLWPQPMHFAAAARDLRDSPDRFGVPRSGILRQTSATPPQILVTSVLPVDWPAQSHIIAGQTVEISAVWNTADVTAFTLFRDVNRNGIWDHTIDQSLQTFVYTPPTSGSGQTLQVVVDKAWGSGLIVLGVAIRTNPALGDDAWSPVQSGYFINDFQAWVKQPAQSTLSAAGNQPISIDVVARDDNAVRNLSAFIDLNSDNRFGPGDLALANITANSRIHRPQVNYNLMFNAPSTPGSYSIGFYASDFVLANGPVTFVTLVVS